MGKKSIFKIFAFFSHKEVSAEAYEKDFCPRSQIERPRNVGT